MPSSSSSLLGYGASTWSSSAWSSSLSSTPSPSPSPLSITTVTVTVIDDTPSSTHSPSSANTKKTRLKHGHYIAKSISRLLSIYSYSHRFDKIDKTNETIGKERKKGEGKKCATVYKKTNKQKTVIVGVIVSRKKNEKDGKVEGINRGIDGVCVCEGKTSHCRSCD